MEVHKELLIKALEQHELEVTIPSLHLDANQIVTSSSYQALEKIRAIIQDDSIEDAACFQKIEHIICVLEESGIFSGTRHDFKHSHPKAAGASPCPTSIHKKEPLQTSCNGHF